MKRASNGRPLAVARRAASQTRAPAPSPSGLLGVALLKVALELKRQPGRSPAEVLARLLARLDIPEQELHDLLAERPELRRALAAAQPREKIVRGLRRLHPMD